MLIIDYLKHEYEEYNSEKYKSLYDFFNQFYKELTQLLSESYLKLYKYCLDYTYTEYFQEKGLGVDIFKYKGNSPYSGVFDAINTINIERDADIKQFIDIFDADWKNIQILDDSIESHFFKKRFENSSISYDAIKFRDEIKRIYEKRLDTIKNLDIQDYLIIIVTNQLLKRRLYDEVFEINDLQ